MAITYEELNPTLIENTTMTKVVRDGTPLIYRIYPVDGYVLHDNAGDYHDEDGTTQYTYSGSYCTCAVTYEFTPVTMTVPDKDGNSVTVTAYGSREFFAMPESIVPENNIYSVGDNNHEVM